MPYMIALRKQRYGKRHLVAGDRFEVHPTHVAVLKLARIAEMAPPESAPTVAAESAPDAGPAGAADKPKRNYRRKDMVAEPAEHVPSFPVVPLDDE